MKQTNNAIKFLLAQYRAIFKHAYLKGLASAVVLTAGLAAGASANAADVVSGEAALSGTDPITIDGTTHGNLQMSVSGTDLSWNTKLTISSGSGSDSANFIKSTSGASSFTGSGSLIIDNAEAGLLIQNSGSGALTINLTSDEGFNVQKGSLTLDASGSTIELDLKKLTVGNGSDTAKLNVFGASNAVTIKADTFEANSGGRVVLSGSGATFNVEQLTMNEGSLLDVQSGTAHAVNFGKVETPTESTLNDVNIASGASLTLKGASTETNLTLNGELAFAGSGTVTLKSGSFNFVNATLSGSSSNTGTIALSGIGNTLKLAGESFTTFAGQSGSLDLSNASGSTVEFSGTVVLGSSGTQIDIGSGKDIVDATGVSLKFADLTIGSAVSGSNANIQADKLTLKSGGDLKLSGELSVANELAVSGNSITLVKAVNLTHEETAAQAGTVTGDALTVSGAGALKFLGEWLVNNKGLTLQSAQSVDSGANVTFNNAVTVSGSGITLTANSGSTVTFGSASNLTLSGDSTTSFTAKSGSNVTFENGSKLSVGSGSFIAENSSINLSNVEVAKGTSGSIIASGSEAEITIGSVVDGIKYKADAGSLVANKLEISSTQITDTSANAGIIIDNDGKLIVDSLTFSDTNGATISNGNGVIQVNQSLSAKSGSITFNGANLALQLGTTDTKNGSIDSDLVVANTTTLLGTWSTTNNLQVSGSSGKFNVGNGTDSGTLTTDTIIAKDSGKFTVNQGSTLNVNGIESDKNAGEAGYAGFDLEGKTVTVSGGTFVIGKTAAGQLMTDGWSKDGEENHEDGLAYNNFGKYELYNNGSLQIDFFDAGIESLTMDQFTELKIELISNANQETGVITTGSLNIGATDIEGITTGDSAIVKPSADGSGSELTYNDYLQFKDKLSGTEQDDIKQAQLTKVTGEIDSMHVGSVALADGEKAEFTGTSSLNNADGTNLIVTKDGSTGGADLGTGAILSLNDDGNVKDVTLTAGSAGSNTILNANKTNTLNSVIAGSKDAIAANTKFVVGTEAKTTVTGAVVVETLTNNNELAVGGNVDTKTFNNNKAFSSSGAVTTTNFADVADATTTAKSLTIKDKSTVAGTVNVIDFTLTSEKLASVPSNPADKYEHSTVTGSVNASKGTADLSYVDIASNASVNAKTAKLDKFVNIDAGGKLISNETTIGVIEDGTNNVTADISIAGYAELGDVSFTSGSGTIESSLNVLGGSVTADSVTGTAGAVIAVGADAASNDESGATGIFEITGSLNLNGATLKVDPEYDQDTALVVAKTLSGATTGKDSNDVGTFNGNVFVGQNSAFGVGVSLSELKGVIAQYQTNGHLADPNENDEGYGAILYLDKTAKIADGNGITLTAGTAKELYDDLDDRITGGITSSSNNAMKGFDPTATSNATYAAANTIYFGNNTALAINTNTKLNANQAYITFEGATGKLVSDGGDIILTGDSLTKQIQLFSSNVKVVDIKDQAATEDSGIEVKSANEFLTGKLTDASKGQVTLEVNEEKAAAIMTGASTPVYNTILAYGRGYNGDYVDKAAGETVAPENELFSYDSKGNRIDTYNNTFLSKVTYGQGSAADVEKVARLGVYGGVAQAALTAGASTYEAVNGRMGIGAQTGSITFADNGQGAGLWVTPVYKNHDSDGFDAQGVSYGADLDLYGVALGGDYTLANGLRVGAAFNVGSGDADGQGAGAGVSNDFDYYGFTVYGGYTLDKLSVVADISYTAIDNDVEANTGVEKVTASMDSSNLSVGVTGQYAFDMNGVSVTPHAGLRYTYIDMDDYTVKGSEDIAKYSADSASVFSIPVGVTFAKDIVSGDWTIKPALDLTLTANMGDDSVDGSVTWAGVENLKTNLESEVIDNFTYGATLGVSAKSGNMSFGFGVNYTGASSADEYGVSANARFVF